MLISYFWQQQKLYLSYKVIKEIAITGRKECSADIFSTETHYNNFAYLVQVQPLEHTYN